MLDFLYNALLVITVISIGLFVLLSPKSDGRTKTGTKDNAAQAPGCLLAVGLIAGALLFFWSMFL